MQRVRLDQDIRPLSDFRANVTAYLEEIKNNKRPIVITQHGKSSAVVMDVGEYEHLMEKIEVLSDIQVAETQIQAGHAVEHSDALNQVIQDVG